MKTSDFFWEHPALKQHVRELPEGEYLFRQRQPGNTMFIILHGLVELIALRDEQEFGIGLVQAGEFLGEKAIVRSMPYRRALSARAKTQIKFLEMDLNAIEVARKTAPELMNDILRKMFQTAAERLDRMNYLIAGLRSSNNVERLVHLILYYSRVSGRPGPYGVEFLLSGQTVQFYIDMPASQAVDCLKELVEKRLLKRIEGDCYAMPSDVALLESVPSLRNQLKAGYYDDLELELEPAP